MKPFALQALMGSASKLPWRFDVDDSHVFGGIDIEGPTYRDDHGTNTPIPAKAYGQVNAAFITESVNALPALLELWEAALRIEEELRGTLVGMSPTGLALSSALAKLRDM